MFFGRAGGAISWDYSSKSLDNGAFDERKLEFSLKYVGGLERKIMYSAMEATEREVWGI